MSDEESTMRQTNDPKALPELPNEAIYLTLKSLIISIPPVPFIGQFKIQFYLIWAWSCHRLFKSIKTLWLSKGIKVYLI